MKIGRLLFFVFLPALLLTLAACGDGGQAEQYAALEAEYDALLSEHEQLQADYRELETIRDSILKKVEESIGGLEGGGNIPFSSLGFRELGSVAAEDGSLTLLAELTSDGSLESGTPTVGGMLDVGVTAQLLDASGREVASRQASVRPLGTKDTSLLLFRFDDAPQYASVRYVQTVARASKRPAPLLAGQETATDTAVSLRLLNLTDKAAEFYYVTAVYFGADGEPIGFDNREAANLDRGETIDPGDSKTLVFELPEGCVAYKLYHFGWSES